MQDADLLSASRRAAGLTQKELAQRVGTTQPAVAAYESGSRRPGLATLRRLLDGCDFDLELVVSARVRRGALSLAAVARAIRRDLRRASPSAEADATRLLFGFADDFRGSPRSGRGALMAEEPPPTGDARFDAALAGLCEYFAREAGLPVPEWTEAPWRFVEPWWFVTGRPAFHAYVLATTPADLSRHGVFCSREAFDRV